MRNRNGVWDVPAARCLVAAASNPRRTAVTTACVWRRRHEIRDRETLGQKGGTEGGTGANLDDLGVKLEGAGGKRGAVRRVCVYDTAGVGALGVDGAVQHDGGDVGGVAALLAEVVRVRRREAQRACGRLAEALAKGGEQHAVGAVGHARRRVPPHGRAEPHVLHEALRGRELHADVPLVTGDAADGGRIGDRDDLPCDEPAHSCTIHAPYMPNRVA